MGGSAEEGYDHCVIQLSHQVRTEVCFTGACLPGLAMGLQLQLQ